MRAEWGSVTGYGACDFWERRGCRDGDCSNRKSISTLPVRNSYDVMILNTPDYNALTMFVIFADFVG
jgi:hypothetical protein